MFKEQGKPRGMKEITEQATQQWSIFDDTKVCDTKREGGRNCIQRGREYRRTCYKYDRKNKKMAELCESRELRTLRIARAFYCRM